MKSKKSVKNENNSNIIINDIYLHLLIGQWLGITNESIDTMEKAFQISYRYKYTNKSYEQIIKKVHIQKNKLMEINKKFRELLDIIGIDKDEICVLDKLGVDTKTFNCHFLNKNEDAKISLNWGDFFESLPELSIEQKCEKKIYEYYKSYNNDYYKFRLSYVEEDNYENGNNYRRFYNTYFVNAYLENDNYKITLQINNIDNINTTSLFDHNFILNNEEQLKNYLLGLEFPVEVDNLYKNISKIIKPIKDYTRFKLIVSKKIDDKNKITTDKIILKNGKLESFLITKKGKKILISDNNSWEYETKKIHSIKYEDGNINFELKNISEDELSQMTSISNEYDCVTKEIESIKELSKTL